MEHGTMDEAVDAFDPCELLTVRRVADLLGVSEPTVRSLVKHGELPVVGIGRARRVPRADLRRFVERRRRYREQPEGGAPGREAEPPALFGGPDDGGGFVEADEVVPW